MGLMGMMRPIGPIGLIGLMALISLWSLSSSAQIKIGGNVYGGGNHAEVKGSTKVTVKAGDIGAVLDPKATRPLEDPQGKVFGGARMANVGGSTFVHIDGEHATDYILINQVYGGNDIAGKIGTAMTVGENKPTELTAVKAAEDPDPKKNVITNTFNSYVRISSKLTADVHYTQEECNAYNGAHSLNEGDEGFLTTASVKTKGGDLHPDNKKIYIGQLFAGGNGDFEYPTEQVDGEFVIKQGETIIAKSKSAFERPELDSTYLEVLGGSIVYAYGGGNNATVKEQNIIHIDNPSKVVNHILVNNTTGMEADAATYDGAYGANGTNVAPSGYTDLLTTVRFKEMGINTTFSQPSSGEYQVGRFFGGNNKAEMHIRPTWNLLAGRVRNLYSGGNRGNMTSPEGLLLEIPEYSTLAVDNVYGGCRMADVKPTVDGEYRACTNLTETDSEGNLKYKFPDELSARTLVRGGHINNVYGGNDVTGSVYGGNAIGIYTTIYGDVYGGGNGNYPYTDNEDELKSDDTFGDFFYAQGNSSINSLNAFRPNAEQVSIRLKGTAPASEEDKPNYTVIQGSVYLGGNCASLATKKKTPLVELKIGSYVIADNVFLGNNGAGMVSEDNLKYYAGWVDSNGDYNASSGKKFSTLNLKDGDVFKRYMNGVAMPLKPSIVFDKISNGDPADYEPFSSFIGSLYCGGNVGSMTYEGKQILTIDQGVNIYEKFVGGCNNADVPAGTYNAAYQGGVIGTEAEQASYTDASDNIKDRIEINLEHMTITPLRWNDSFTQLEWNTNKWGYVYNALVAGTELEKGDVYYTSIPYTENTVTGSAYTVKKSDKYFKKLEDNVYISIPTDTELPVDSKYYTYTDSGKKTVGDDGHTAVAGEYIEEQDFVEVKRNPEDDGIRLLGGNVYGGCYESGHVNGNVTININEELLNRNEVFGTAANAIMGNPASGVKLIDQRDDLMAVALSVFGAGYGKETEIWGSTTVNHNNGYAFQIYGGGQEGVVGKKVNVTGAGGVITQKYQFNPAYSSTVNLKGQAPIYSSEGTVDNTAEAEYIYGGGNEGDVCGNTLVNLGNGRVYDAFGGASDANILGHAEVYIGRQPNGSGGYNDGFPWIKDIVYGGNDFGGTIYGAYDEESEEFETRLKARLRNFETDKTQIHGYTDGKIPNVLKSSTYVEYLQGRVDTIFGGGYGSYDYKNTALYGVGAAMPKQQSSFVNIRPKDHTQNALKAVFGGGTGFPGNRADDEAQDRSYVLVDIPDGMEKFKNVEVFGAGSYNGLGMQYTKETTFASGYDRDNISSIIDLLHGEISNAYGGSYNEGVTARTVVNVPANSTIKMKNIFGGAYGTQILPPCDVIQAIVNYSNTSEKASVSKIYGGNNNERRSLFTQVNISSPVWSDKSKGYLATVYGAGHGIDTWSEHTLVNLLKGAKVYEVYGGGEMGHVLNAESVQRYMSLYKDGPSDQISTQDPYWKDASKWTKDGTTGMRTVNPAYKDEWDADWKDAWKLGKYYEPNADFNNYFEAFAGLRNTSLVYKADIDDRNFSAFSDDEKAKRQYIYSTNVIINDGAEVVNYAYGGGYGTSEEERSGDVYGHTYIALLGGTVKKDIYAAGTAGNVNDIFRVGRYNASTNPYGFTSSTTAYIKGGTCRNVYGGGWEGNVGAHTGSISDSPASDVPAETHVIIGDLAGGSYTAGLPAVQRNVYGGGEGGAVFGTAYLTMNNGYVGYEYKDKKYEEKTEDDTKATPNTLLEEAGCVFGGGYIDDSTVDKTYVTINGGHIRNSVFGGGEIAAIGRGDMQEKTGGTDYELKGIYRPGKTNVKMYSGHVHRNVFGGGRGYDNLNRHGSLHNDGYVFGQTEVSIHGGEIGTVSGVADGDGNVFGGGDVGFVYSAYENANGTFGRGVKDGVRYDGLYQGYYFKHKWYGDESTGSNIDEDGFYTETVNILYKEGDDIPEGKKVGDVKESKTERQFTEDCKVLVEPQCKVNVALTIDGTSYSKGDYVPIEKLNKLENKNTDATRWSCLDQTGIIIHNAVFAGGNANSGSLTTGANTNTVFGNATASINDVFHRDLITLGTRHTGGLYGDGNLTLVDGYRELNITNYGTDYYSIAKEIDINTYHTLPEREAAYYELNYTCMKRCEDKNKTIYTPASGNTKAATITADDMLDLFLVKNGDTYVSIQNDASGNYVTSGGTAVLVWNETQKAWEPNSAAGYWVESGVLPVYAGRLMNSIQRADLCGVFGSRMVMQGAQDRVPEEVDYTNYTINRVREVSLNKMDSKITSDLNIAESSDEYYKKHTHGNYFGIYNVVNYLGALTSDVHFTDVRKTDNTSNDELYKRTIEGGAYNTATYYDWKKENIKNKTRNNGASHNKVALASGVYLEITTEESTGTDLNEKVWGPITGVVELDLINVSTGIGGGFVYAKNVHGIPSLSGAKNTTLTALNEKAVTQWDYTYDTTDDADHQKEWESSGNFVHSTQTIIDDCYNVSNRYYGTGKMPAHYWYIKGSVYVYDQYISAYTGQSNAFSEVVDIPLTIAAASHGKMKLLNVMPNRYAYYAKPGEALGDGKKMIINGKTYYKNDPISYWDWYLLSNYEKELFVQKTYVVKDSCYINSKYYAPGDVILPDEYNTLSTKANANKQVLEVGEAAVAAVKRATKDSEGNPIVVTNDAGNDVYAAFDFIFHESNNVSHDEGYILTYEVNNPSKWDNWFTKKNDVNHSKITLLDYNKGTTVKSDYEDGPTYRLKATSGGAVLGQSEYKHGDLIPEGIYYTYEGKTDDLTNYPGIKSHITSSNGTQATFEKAYIVKNKITVSGATSDTYYNPGTAVSATFAGSHSSDCEEAYICTKTIEMTKEKVIYRGSKMKMSEATGYVTEVQGKMGNSYKDMTLDEIKALTVSESLTAEKKKELISLATLRDDLQNCLVQAYYCTSKDRSEEGYDGPYYYGGNYYVSGYNYRGLEAWSSMSAIDREQFTFNYDALDLLIDKNYTTTATYGAAMSEGHKYQYDSAAGTLAGAEANAAHYSLETSVDYTAEYNSNTDSPTLTNNVNVTHSNGTTGSVNVLTKGDELSREEFEGKLLNEVRHYAAVAVKNTTEEKVKNAETGLEESTGKYLVYVVNTPFQVGSTPYAVGETISSATYTSLSGTEQGYVTPFKFNYTDVQNEVVYYYCRESYTPVTPVTAISSSTIPGAGGGISDGKVQLGTLINSDNYGLLKNEQKNFTIHGASPTETSTLYVSRESNINDLSKEKIITVIYEYDYDETDTQGNVTPISERHVLNIHLTFKSGVPTIEDITPPEIILPGDRVSLREPTVTPGAYEVTGGGWEIFATQRDAESHTNGVEYNPTFNELYWYQDNYYVAYYAKSYLGRTYSNAVPVSVANYHDLKKVMDDTENHYYIDHRNVKRNPKIYINDYSASGKNGLDLFKNLYDLSLVTGSGDDYTVTDGKITAADESANSNLVGHALLSNQTRAERNLEFFMRTDIDHGPTTEPNPSYNPADPESPTTITVNHPWTPIGYDGVCDNPATTDVDEGATGKCFDGVFHGDGHTISGLDHSLFNYLCGEVYNLGVMGSFNGAGIAEQGGGYVESCWTRTTNETALSTKPYPVFGAPSDNKGYQVVNSYYYDGNKGIYNTTDGDPEITYTNGSRGNVTRKSAQAFYNGELAYDLNNFYLYKRYSDKQGLASGVSYDYFTIGEDDKPVLHMNQYYVKNDNAKYCSTGTGSGTTYAKYVEDRFADGDFRYAAGEIPETVDERHWIEVVKEVGEPDKEVNRFSPIWPDDYIFFGQKLTYGHDETYAHQEVPTAVVRDGGRLSYGDNANRVYRAPAYYGTKEMGVAHFNPTAYLAQKSSDGTKTAYPGMTAIDFAGHEQGHDKSAFKLGLQSGLFYAPLLDDDGLTSIQNCDETQNLLVYAPAASGESDYVNSKTHGVLTSYFVDPVFNEYYDVTGTKYDDGRKYRRVEDATALSVNGHIVQSTLVATNDHLLVDKQDFNCPIAYDFDKDHLMWYQRKPADYKYVDLTKGWQGISVPFTAELVTTDQKGEITHFYNDGGDNSKGHEYWLRELTNNSEMKLKAGETKVLEADFHYPSAGGDNKTVGNTFLWDYYYVKTDRKDKNEDKYQQYYSDSRTYNRYPLLTKATPYILGLPGETYYEFDLSGKFVPKNTAAAISRLSKQTITLASNKREHIVVSDDEMTGTKVTYGGNDYYFRPSYMNKSLDPDAGNYALNSDGNDFVRVSGEAKSVSAFRPYFTGPAVASSRKLVPERIALGGSHNGLEQEPISTLDGGLEIYVKDHRIIATSHLKEPVTIWIMNVGGITLANYVLQPGETQETRVQNTGVYIVNKKKLFVK